MSKIVLLLVLVAVAVQGYPVDDIASAAARGDWDAVHKLLSLSFDNKSIWKPISSGSVKSLKPLGGGHVYGESEYTFHSSSNVGGQTQEQSGGHKVINNDGKVSEYDFKPKI
ncbi:uncharacterized protein LOC131843445 [Achroia grisella]|uniref:uncharacterized protein LOC131843445 n=1 Tax=Achroia grisella TaxID=688607 RepID=UPI0027D27127|nr:uncharacterized protein LOC131843445 [Achroia grisella]